MQIKTKLKLLRKNIGGTKNNLIDEKNKQLKWVACFFYLKYYNYVSVPGSSSGRTEDSGSSNGGSNPSPGVLKYMIYLTE